MNKSILKNNKGSIEMVNTGITLIVLLVVLYVGVNILDNVGDATVQSDATAATGIYSSFSPPTDGRLINVSTVTFEINTSSGTPITAGHVEVYSSGTILSEVTNLTLAINTNVTTSALVIATNQSATVHLVAKAKGTSGNSIATTENRDNAEWTAATLTGGSAESELYDSQQNLISVTEDSYAMAGIMPIVMIAVAVLGGLLGVLYLFRGRD